MKKYSKKILNEIKRLQSIVEERERTVKLKELYDQMQKWKSGKIDDMEMERTVKNFVPVKTAQRRKAYREDSDPGLPIVDALLNSYLSREDIPDDVYKELQILMKVVEI